MRVPAADAPCSSEVARLPICVGSVPLSEAQSCTWIHRISVQPVAAVYHRVPYTIQPGGTII